MRTGAYGNRHRRTYGVLGDDTNLAARLMAKAAPQEILISAHAARRQGEIFELQPLPSIRSLGRGSRPHSVFPKAQKSAPEPPTIDFLWCKLRKIKVCRKSGNLEPPTSLGCLGRGSRPHGFSPSQEIRPGAALTCRLQTIEFLWYMPNEINVCDKSRVR